jgi:hypothetical protein
MPPCFKPTSRLLGWVLTHTRAGLRHGAVVSAEHEPAPITIRQQCTQSSLGPTDFGMLCPTKDPAEDTKPRHASEQKRAGHLYGGCRVGAYGHDSSRSEANANAVSFMDADEKMAAVTPVLCYMMRAVDKGALPRRTVLPR